LLNDNKNLEFLFFFFKKLEKSPVYERKTDPLRIEEHDAFFIEHVEEDVGGITNEEVKHEGFLGDEI